jgi:predicted transposase YbfD/YdcC
VAAQTVVELTREVTFLRGKHRGTQSLEKIYYVSSRPVLAHAAKDFLEDIRLYWGIENGLHQRLDVSAQEDASRVRNRNSLLVLGLLRRAAMSLYQAWRAARKNKRQSTLKDFHDAMARHHHRGAGQILNGTHP